MIAIFPEIVTCVASGDLERLSIIVRRYFARTDAQRPCLDMRVILGNLGIEVQKINYPDFGSLLARDDKGQFHITIVLSDRPLLQEQERFLLAHMLGHYLLHVQPKIAQGEFTVSGFRETLAPWQRFASGPAKANIKAVEAREVEADNFAAALLMPRSMVAKAQTKLDSLEKLATFFGVSADIMGMRLELLNPESPAATTPTQKSGGKTGTARRGMDRIRQIAKLMDRAK